MNGIERREKVFHVGGQGVKGGQQGLKRGHSKAMTRPGCLEQQRW